MTAAQAHLFEGVSGLLINRRKAMIQFFRKLFCFHAYEFDYDDKHGYTHECRKCGKED